LEEHQENCEKSGRFVEADIAKKKVEELKKIEEEKQLMEVKKIHEEQVKI